MALETFVVFGDPHGDEICPVMRAAFLRFLKDFKPKILVNAGDNWNFSHLRGKASQHDENASAQADWECGEAFFNETMAFGKRRFFLRGNHDERLWDTRHGSMREIVREAADYGIKRIESLVKRRNVTMLPYHSRTGVLDIDGLRVLHGYSAGVGAARKFAQVYGSCAFAHTHSMDVAPVEKWPETSVAYGTGCLMIPEQGYNSRDMGKLRHENGWLYGFIKNGKATFFQAKLNNGQVYASTEIKAY